MLAFQSLPCRMLISSSSHLFLFSLASTDPGFIGTSTLVPSTFATGSYGWKGNKRFTVELENPEGGEKEKVHVMIT